MSAFVLNKRVNSLSPIPCSVKVGILCLSMLQFTKLIFHFFHRPDLQFYEHFFVLRSLSFMFIYKHGKCCPYTKFIVASFLPCLDVHWLFIISHIPWYWCILWKLHISVGARCGSVLDHLQHNSLPHDAAL